LDRLGWEHGNTNESTKRAIEVEEKEDKARDKE
jgi:hypothetical protein